MRGPCDDEASLLPRRTADPAAVYASSSSRQWETPPAALVGLPSITFGDRQQTNRLESASFIDIPDGRSGGVRTTVLLYNSVPHRKWPEGVYDRMMIYRGQKSGAIGRTYADDRNVQHVQLMAGGYAMLKRFAEIWGEIESGGGDGQTCEL